MVPWGLVVRLREPVPHIQMVGDEHRTEGDEETYIMRGRLGWVKIRWCEGPPHAPTTIDVLVKECLRSGWVDMKLAIIGEFTVSHFNRCEVENTGDEKHRE